MKYYIPDRVLHLVKHFQILLGIIGSLVLNLAGKTRLLPANVSASASLHDVSQNDPPKN